MGTKKFGLLGFPLGHSFSKGYHNERFARWGIDARYDNYELPHIHDLQQLIGSDPQLLGLNVTIPYKEAVIPLLDELDEAAREIGAVNVIRILRNGDNTRTIGYNTDYIGFRNAISPLLKPHHTHALVLGTGGASKAVCTALAHLGLSVQRVSRTPHDNAVGYEALSPDMMARHTVIVNATPLGMSPHTHTHPNIPYNLLTASHLCFDVVYNPTTTRFMELAAQQGATVCNGLAMLHGQADAAWEIWSDNDTLK